MRSFRRWTEKRFGPQPTFVQPQMLESENTSTKKCVKIVVQPPGKDGFQDSVTIWALKDSGSDVSIIHKSLCDTIYGDGNFHWYPKPRDLCGLGGNPVQSLGRRHVYLSFKGQNEVYTAEVDVVKDSHGAEPDNFDILLCETFFRTHRLLKWSEKISGKVNYIMKTKRYNQMPQTSLIDVKEHPLKFDD